MFIFDIFIVYSIYVSSACVICAYYLYDHFTSLLFFGFYIVGNIYFCLRFYYVKN